jgi:hypothetical protein
MAITCSRRSSWRSCTAPRWAWGRSPRCNRSRLTACRRSGAMASCRLSSARGCSKMLEEYQSDPEEGLAAICTMRRRRGRPHCQPLLDGDGRAGAFDPQGGSLTDLSAADAANAGALLDDPRRVCRDVLRGLHIREEGRGLCRSPRLRPAADQWAQKSQRPARRTRNRPAEGEYRSNPKARCHRRYLVANRFG